MEAAGVVTVCFGCTGRVDGAHFNTLQPIVYSTGSVADVLSGRLPGVLRGLQGMHSEAPQVRCPGMISVVVALILILFLLISCPVALIG